MPKHWPFTLRFPLGGLDRRYAFQDQAPYTTPDCLNVWPLDVTTGRERGGVRPGVTSIASRGNDPYAWTAGSYVDSGSKEALFVTFADGTYSTLDGATWTSRIAVSPGTDFCSCALYRQVLFQAQAGAVTKQRPMPSGSTADLDDSGSAVPAPSDCALVVAHLDALWLAGDPANPQIITKSATADYTDWDTAKNSISGAWSNAGEAGQINNAITAGLSHSSSVILWGAARATYAVVGNPRNQGSFRRISSDMGPLTNNAWCKGQGPNGEAHTYLFTTNGLAVIPESNLSIDLLSKNKIPDELQGVDPANGDNVAIGFDSRWKGIHITVRLQSGETINYFYYIPSDSYWPEDFGTDDFMLYPTFAPVQTATTSAVLPITDGGAVHQFDSESTEDFNSYLDLGPLRLGDATREGYVAWMSASLADGSDDCYASIRGGDSIEEAFYQTSAARKYTFQKWTIDGYNYSQNPRIGGGHAAYVTIFDVDNERWIFEEINGERGIGGHRRVG